MPRLRRLLDPGRSDDARTAGRQRMAGNAGLEMLSRLIAIATGLVTFPLLARTLGPEEFGTWTAGLAYVGLFSAVSEFGLVNAATMKIAAEPEREEDWMGALSSLRTSATVVLTALCLAGIPLFLSGGKVQTVALIGSVLVMVGGAMSLQAVFRARLRASIPLALTVVQSIAWVVVVLVLASVDAGVVTAVTAYVTMLAVMAALSVAAARRAVRVRWSGSRRHWNELLRIALPIGFGGLFVTVYFSIDAVLLYEMAGERETGLYGAAYRFLGPLAAVPAVVMGALFPVIAAHWATDRERVQRLFQRGADYMAVISLPAVATTAVLSEPIVRTLFGDGFERTADVLPILMIAFVGVCYGNLAGYLAPVFGLQWRIAIYAGAGAALNVVLNVLLIPRHGAFGSAWATVATEAVTMTLLLGTEMRMSGLRIGVSRIARTLLAAGAMAGLMLALRPVGLLPALVGGGLLYGGLVVGLGVVPLAELRSLRRGAA
jgi:O-antigen/teichoic acid export membrane protein